MAHQFAFSFPASRMALLGVCCLVLPGGMAVFAQAPAKEPAPVIRGMVLESGTDQPVVDARVSLSFLGKEDSDLISGAAVTKPVAETRTDASGAFSIAPRELGRYHVAASKAGYSSVVMGASGGHRSSMTLTLTAVEPGAEARLHLSRHGRIVGRIVDSDTAKPLEGFKVSVRSVTNRLGMRLPIAQASPLTGPDGSFAAEGLAPGDYIIATGPQAKVPERLSSKFSESDLSGVEEDYEIAYYPGASPSVEASLPVKVALGSTADAGTLHVSKTTYYRALLHIPAILCKSGEKVSLVRQTSTGNFGSWQVVCGQDVLIPGFPRGAHRLIAAHQSESGARNTAIVPVVITDQNVELTAALLPPFDVSGKVTAFENSKLPDLSAVSIRLLPNIPLTGAIDPGRPKPDGIFQVSQLPPGSHQLLVLGLPKTHYVKEIRWNDVPVKENVVELGDGASGQPLNIVLDDRPAVVMGAVLVNSKPIPGALVILQKWPAPPGRIASITASAVASERGEFSIGGLTPGQYRILAVSTAAEEANRPPGVLERALATAKEIELGPRGLERLVIEVQKLE